MASLPCEKKNKKIVVTINPLSPFFSLPDPPVSPAPQTPGTRDQGDAHEGRASKGSEQNEPFLPKSVRQGCTGLVASLGEAERLSTLQMGKSGGCEQVFPRDGTRGAGHSKITNKQEGDITS